MNSGSDAGDPSQAGNWLTPLRLVLGAISGAALFGMMTLTFFDVVGRKFLNHSIGGSVELTELMMLALIFGALPLASLAGEHVIFDLLDAILPERVKRWQSVIANLICTVLVGCASWFVFERALRTQSMGDTTAQLQIPVAPFHYAAAVLLAISALLHLFLALSGRRRG